MRSRHLRRSVTVAVLTMSFFAGAVPALPAGAQDVAGAELGETPELTIDPVTGEEVLAGTVDEDTPSDSDPGERAEGMADTLNSTGDELPAPPPAPETPDPVALDPFQLDSDTRAVLSEDGVFDPATSREVPSKRTENARTWLNADGTYTLELHSRPVHYKQGGDWAPLDLALVAKGDGWGPKAAKATKLGRKGDSTLVSYDVDGHLVTMSLDGADASVTGVSDGTAVTYKSIRPGADLVLRPVDTGFKDDVVLHGPDSTSSFKWLLDLDGLQARDGDKGAIELVDEDEQILAVIPAPFVTDAGGVEAEAAHQKLSGGAGNPTITITVDRDYLGADLRKFPVTIDPQLNDFNAGSDDTYVASNAPGSNFSGSDTLKVGSPDAGQTVYASYMHFPGTEYLYGQKILAAELYAWNHFSQDCNAKPVSVYPISQGWNGASLVWPGTYYYDSPVTNWFSYGNPYCANDAWAVFNVKQAVTDWSTGAIANNGLMMYVPPGPDRTNSLKEFSASQLGGMVLRVNYTPYWASVTWPNGSPSWSTPLTATTTGYMSVKVCNEGLETFTPTNEYKVAYHVWRTGTSPTTSSNAHLWEGRRTSFPNNLPRGWCQTMNVAVDPLGPGSWNIGFDVLREGHVWYSSEGVSILPVTAVVSSAAPVITSVGPANGAVVADNTITLSASATDADNYPGGVEYYFRLCEGSNAESGVCHNSGWSAAKTYTTGALNWNQTYFWHVYVREPGGTNQVNPNWVYSVTTALPQSEGANFGNDDSSVLLNGVNPVNGNLTLKQTDLTVAANSDILELSRTYNSMDTDAGWDATELFGSKWTSAWDVSIEDQILYGYVRMRQPNGSRAVFGRNPDGSFTTGVGASGQLTAVAGGGWKHTRTGGVTYTFDTTGRLTRIADPSGNGVLMNRNSGGEPTSMLDERSGRSITIDAPTIRGGPRITAAATGPTSENTTWDATVTKSAPAGYWPLGSSGSSDKSGNGRNLTIVGSPAPLTVSGPWEGSSGSYFSGDRLTAADHATYSVGTDGTAVSLWMEPMQLPAAGTTATVIAKGVGSSAEWSLEVNSDGYVQLVADGVRTSSAKVASDHWAHVAFSIDANSSGVLIVNGRVIRWGPGSAPADQSGLLSIAAKPDGSSPFNGTVADVAVMSGSLSQPELVAFGLTAEPYRQGALALAPTAYWDFNQGTIFAEDATGRGRDGVSTGVGPALDADLDRGRADGERVIVFDGSDTITVPDGNGWISPTSPTYSFWLRVTDGPTGAVRPIFRQGTAASGIGLSLDASTMSLVLTANNSTGAQVSALSSVTLAAGRWTHITVRYSTSAGAHLFIDGSAATRAYVTHNGGPSIPTGLTFGGGINMRIDDVSIASGAPSTSALKSIVGAVDDGRDYSSVQTLSFDGGCCYPQLAGSTQADVSHAAYGVATMFNGTLGNQPRGAGFSGKSAATDGVDDVVRIDAVPGQPAPQTADSYAFWYKPTAPTGGWRGVFSKGTGGANLRGPSLFLWPNDMRLHLAHSTSATSQVTVDSTEELRVGKWHHILITEADADDGGQLYVNGRLQGSLPKTALTAVTGSLHLGRADGAYGAGGFDEFSVIGAVRDPAVLAASGQDWRSGVHNGPDVGTIDRDIPVGWWSFNEPSGTTVADRGPNALTGTMTGASNGRGVAGQLAGGSTAASMNAGAVQIPHNDAFNSKTFAVETWASYNDVNAGKQTIAHKTVAGGSTWSLWYDDAANNLNASATFDGKLVTLSSANGSAGAGMLHHAVVSYDGQRFQLLLNGNVVASNVAPGPRTLEFGTGAMFIGADSATATSAIRGVVDEVVVWRRGVPATEALARFNAGKHGKGTEVVRYQYDAEGDLVRTCSDRENPNSCTEHGTSSNITGITGPDGVAALTFGWSGTARVTSATSAETGKLTFSYGTITTNADGNKIGTTTVTSPDSDVSSYEWLENSGVRRITASTDGGQGRTSFAYDAMGRLTRTTDPTGGWKETVYDSTTGYPITTNVWRADGTPDGQILSTHRGFHKSATSTDPLNGQMLWEQDARSTSRTDTTYRTTNTYTAAGLLATTITPGPETVAKRTVANTYTTGTEAAVGGGTMPPGKLKTTQQYGFNPTTYAYDAKGDTRSVTAPSGLVTQYTYDLAGRRLTETVVSDTFPSGTTTVWTYERFGRVATITAPATVDAVTGATHQAKTSFTYDRMGNVTRQETVDLNNPTIGRYISFSYDNAGRPSSETEGALSGGATRTTSRTYSSEGNVATETSADGAVTAFAYTPRNEVATITATNVVDVLNPGTPRDIVLESRGYDSAGRVRSVTTPGGGGVATTLVTDYTSDGLPKRSYYDDVDLGDGQGPRDVVRHSATYDNAGHIVSEVDAAGTTTTHAYDAAGRAYLSVLDPTGLNLRSQVTYEFATEPAALVEGTPGGATRNMQFKYDTAGRQFEQRRVSTTGPVADDRVTRQTFDQRNLVTAVDPPAGISGTDYLTVDPAYRSFTSYDAMGLPVTTTGPQVTEETYGGGSSSQRAVTTTGYDVWGQITSSKDPFGKITTSTYDLWGNATGGTSPAYTRPDGATPSTARPTYEFDLLGNPTKLTAADGGVSDFIHDRFGRLVTVTGPADSSGSRPVTVTRYDDAGNSVEKVSPTGQIFRQTYDALGRQRSFTTYEGASSFSTTWQVDDADRPTSMTSAGGVTHNTTYRSDGQVGTLIDGAGKTTTSTYDQLGRLTSTIDPTGRATQRTFNGFDEAVTEQQMFNGVAQTATSTVYGRAGLPTSHTDATGWTSSATYNALGTLASVTVPVDATTSITETAGYDRAGRLTRATDGRGNATWTTYNAWGLTESLIEPATAAHPNPGDRTWTTNYNTSGLADKVTAPGGVTSTRTFDKQGRQLTESAPAVGSAPAVSRNIAYDLAGRPISVGQTAGTTTSNVTMSYDARGLLDTVTGAGTAASYDWTSDAKLASKTDANGTTSATYGPTGAVATWTDPLWGSALTFTYDDAGRPTTIDGGGTKPDRTFTYDPVGRVDVDAVKTSAGAVLHSIDYGYNAAGDIATQAVSPAGVAGAGTTTFGYDRSHRMTSWAAPSAAAVTYGYDAAGNRTSAGGQSAVYDQRNRLTNATTAARTSTFGYDARGNRTSASTPATTATVAFVVGNSAALTTNETAVRNRLVSMGLTVTNVDDGTAEVTGYGIVVIADTAAAVGAKYMNSASPVISLDPGSWDDQGLSTAAGSTSNSTSVAVLSPAHAAAGTATGTVTHSSSNKALGTVTDAQLGSGASQVLDRATTNTNNAGFAYDTGAARASGGATPARRYALGFGDGVTASLTAAGWSLFEAGVRWAGNLSPASSTSSTFDAFDQLVSQTHDGATTAFTYDPMGRMKSAGATTFTYSGQDRNQIGDGTSRWSDGPVAGLRFEAPAVGAGSMLRTNHRADVLGVVSQSGVMSGTRSFDPWGTVAAVAGSSQPVIGFQGDWANPAGQVNMDARWYDPTVGAFASRDTVDDPSMSNRYGYTDGNPVSFYDPTGHWADPGPYVTSGIVIGGGTVVTIATAPVWLVVAGGITVGVGTGWVLHNVFGGDSKLDRMVAGIQQARNLAHDAQLAYNTAVWQRQQDAREAQQRQAAYNRSVKQISKWFSDIYSPPSSAEIACLLAPSCVAQPAPGGGGGTKTRSPKSVQSAPNPRPTIPTSPPPPMDDAIVDPITSWTVFDGYVPTVTSRSIPVPGLPGLDGSVGKEPKLTPTPVGDLFREDPYPTKTETKDDPYVRTMHYGTLGRIQQLHFGSWQFENPQRNYSYSTIRYRVGTVGEFIGLAGDAVLAGDEELGEGYTKIASMYMYVEAATYTHGLTNVVFHTTSDFDARLVASGGTTFKETLEKVQKSCDVRDVTHPTAAEMWLNACYEPISSHITSIQMQP